MSRIDLTTSLTQVLKDHKLWLEGKGGSQANLSSVDLRSADLSSANLRSANLSSANLSSADLSLADLSSADLSLANLSSVDLRSADLSSANLRSANLSSANLRSADLSLADLSLANLTSADLSLANLRAANLKLHELTIVPETGSFIGYKKSKEGVIIKLQVLEDSKRVNAIGSRKCRASKIKILEFLNEKQNITLTSQHDCNFSYKINQILEIKDFDNNLTNECAPGIHFFLTIKEAEEYTL